MIGGIQQIVPIISSKYGERRECDRCPYVTSIQSHMIRHKKCHGDLSKKLVCSHHPCDFGAGNRSNLDRHERLHEVSNKCLDEPTISSFGTKTDDDGTLGSHKSKIVLQQFAIAQSKAKMKSKVHINVRVTHSSRNRNSKGQFVDSNNNNPQRTISKDMKNPKYYRYKCPACGFGTDRKDNFKRHRARHDLNRPKFPCRICLKTFARNDGLLKHIRNCHRGRSTWTDESFRRLSPKIEMNDDPEMFVRDETGAKDEVDQDQVDEVAQDQVDEDEVAQDQVDEDEAAPALVLFEVPDLPEHDPDMPKIDDICYQTETDQDLLKESDYNCIFCSYAAKLSYYLRIHLAPCQDCHMTWRT